jgi:hypothetical protein
MPRFPAHAVRLRRPAPEVKIFLNAGYPARSCNSNIEMTPLCKIDVTLPGVRGASGVRGAGGVDCKKEFDRLEVLLGIRSGRLRVADACELLNLKRRQVFRLLAGLKHGGAASLVSKRRGRPSNNRLPEAYP